mgnify:CR=1 FL=1
MFDGIATRHALMDGNKRAGAIAALTFIGMNGVFLLWCETRSLTPQTQNLAPPGPMSGSLLVTCRSSSTPSHPLGALPRSIGRSRRARDVFDVEVAASFEVRYIMNII